MGNSISYSSQKKDHGVRVVGDYKCTVNPNLHVNQYPLPSQKEIFATLSGGKVFSSVDASDAYQQILLDKDDQEILTLNTHLGLMRPTRLMYGVASAAAIFQKAVDQILYGLEGVNAFQDDMLTTGVSESDNLVKLREVLLRCRKHNVVLNRSKCKFLQQRITFLGHIIDKHGVHPTSDKVDAIKNAPSPTNISELRAFLGMLNYYGRFFPNMSSILFPLHQLLHKDVPWVWSTDCQKTFDYCKEFLTSDTVLVHYDVRKPLKLFCDASPTGLGVVLSHVMPDGLDRPVAYASRTLSSAERNYSQIEREALAIIYGITHFQQYLVGRRFILVTDHQPLVIMFGPNKGIPALAAARLRRWALLLSTYTYTIEYRKGSEHLNADTLSRLPCPSTSTYADSQVFKLSHVEDLPVTAKEISLATSRDPVLGRVLSYVQTGWPKIPLSEALTPFYTRKDQLSVDCGCLVWGLRVIIPVVLRKSLMNLLHETHMGMVRMKALARNYVWWPNLDAEIEQLVRDCPVCQRQQSDPPRSPPLSWAWPTSPWFRLHVDLAHVLGRDCLIVFDSHSKWIEAIPLKSTNSACIVLELRRLFAQFGLPSEIVSDNGPQFTSGEFAKFVQMNGVKHTLVPAYHPASNGAAERAVRVVKTTMKSLASRVNDSQTFQCSLSRALFLYRITPHSTTGKSPVELLLGRTVRSRLSLVRPGAFSVVPGSQGSSGSARKFFPGQKVWVRNHAKGDKWVQGFIVSIQSARTYVVRVGLNTRNVHVDQLRPDFSSVTEPCVVSQPDFDFPVVPRVPEPNVALEASTVMEPPDACLMQEAESPRAALVPLPVEDLRVSPELVPSLARDRPRRVIKAPSRFDL